MTLRAGLMCLLLTIASTIQTQEPAQTGVVPKTPAEEAGKRIYEREKCSACHQIANRGNSRWPLDGVGARLTATQLRRWMTHTAEMEAALPRLPPIRMSARKYRLPDKDLDALVAYLLTLK
jgi:cbb3-type cytochrome oxidase cytochrome c subunit